MLVGLTRGCHSGCPALYLTVLQILPTTLCQPFPSNSRLLTLTKRPQDSALMNGLDVDHPHYKPLSRNDYLPPPPEGHDSTFPPPPLPPKSLRDEADSMRPPHLANLPSFGSLDAGTISRLQLIIRLISHTAGLVIPLTPTTPVTPSSPTNLSSEAKSKKTNPLNDLIDTEKAYVDQLTGIIRVRLSRAVHH